MNLRHARTLLWLLPLWTGCDFNSYRFYDVMRTVEDVCDIRPEGSFCDPEVLLPPINEGWSVERVDGDVRVIFDEELWRGAPTEDDPRRLKLTKTDVTSINDGVCRTTRVRTLDVSDADATLSGTLVEETRTEGASDCGQTPVGQQISFAIAGTQVWSP